MRILVVENELRLSRKLGTALRQEGYSVDIATDGEIGLFKVECYDYDAVVLDLRLPRLDGWEVLHGLRKTKRTPVILLMPHGGPLDRVRGLDLGADDCLTTPFDLSELAARLRAIIRRAAGQASSVIELNDIKIDTRTRSVMCGGKAVSLTAREYAILEYLALHRSEVVSRTALYEHVFDEEDHTLSNVMDVHVFSIRRKLKPDLITTRRGQGYCIEA
jgi:two-component system OmpR family response regulator